MLFQLSNQGELPGGNGTRPEVIPSDPGQLIPHHTPEDLNTLGNDLVHSCLLACSLALSH